MKTYSIAFKSRKGHWLTNWNEYRSLEDINWNEVRKFAIENDYQAYGYYYGHNSRNLISAKCRTIIKEIKQ